MNLMPRMIAAEHSTYQIDVLSCLFAMIYKPATFIGGLPINRPCHVVLAENAKRVSDHLTLKHFDNGWSVGIMYELLDECPPQPGFAVGRKNALTNQMQWMFVVPERLFDLLYEGQFMDEAVQFAMRQGDVQDTHSNRSELNKVLFWIGENQEYMWNTIATMNDDDFADAGRVGIVHADGSYGSRIRNVMGTKRLE